ncbi:HAMP domain-containing protein, partial [Acidobacteria bacterium ACD]|nr:HAMP domain-containing protein [Acidobacteria bacterium ACD]
EEARRALGPSGELPPDEFSLNRAAAVVGTDLLLYREGLLAAASRAVPVAGGIAGERLSAGVAVQLADGRTAVAARAEEAASRGLQAIEGALLLSRSPAAALAVVVPEDESVRTAVDGLVLFAVAGVLAAVVLGSRAALALSRPVDDVVRAADRLGSGLPSSPLPRPQAPDLARLVDAFEAMSSRVQERTALLAHEREAAVGLLANLTAAVLLFRARDGEVLLSNPQADRILPGESLPERLADPRWEALASFVRSAESSSEPRESRVAVTEPTGERVYRVVVAPLGSPEGRRAVLLLEDLTEFLRADRLGAWVDAARAVAHDVKNPLTPIRLSAERLLRQASRSGAETPGAMEAAARTILRQVSILTQRIGRLGRFSDPAVVSLRPMEGEAIRGLLEEVAGDFAHHEGVRWVVEVEEGLPPIRADRDLLRDALTNFALNAVEALSETGGTVRLSAASAPSSEGGRSVTVSCEDDGPGVPEPLLVSLFDPSFSTKARGSGMGLAAARRVVERQGGTVFARPREGGGLSIGFVFAAG